MRCDAGAGGGGPGPVAGLRIVDIGSGEGALARQLAEAGAEVTGVDPLGPPLAPWTRGRAPAATACCGKGAEAMDLRGRHGRPGDVHLLAAPRAAGGAARRAAGGGPRAAARWARLYVAEPVAAGPFQEVTALYHDETAVRAEAAAILAGAGRTVPARAASSTT